MKARFLLPVAAIFLVGGIARVHSEQLTQIAVINISKIISSYFEASYALRQINDMQTKFETDKQAILNKIQNLEQQKLAAQNAGDSQKALQLDNEIFQQRNYLQEFIRIRTNQINQKRDTLLQSPTFLRALVNAIAYVAENNGYSIVLRSDDPSIMYWNNQVDITDKVIARLKKTAN